MLIILKRDGIVIHGVSSGTLNVTSFVTSFVIVYNFIVNTIGTVDDLIENLNNQYKKY